MLFFFVQKRTTPSTYCITNLAIRSHIWTLARKMTSFHFLETVLVL